ncbi:MAG: 4Fe-4S binding protein, partial [Desulfopila sp.]|nr:4Fe-4S binding protein [Desulfopila sp.]
MKNTGIFFYLSERRFPPLLYWRRLSQILFFGVFVFLFIRTDYSGSDHIEYAVNILFRLDPFLAAVTMAAAGAVIALMLPALLVLGLALVFGRSFCGWACPMGTLLDGCDHLLPTNLKGRKTLFPRAGRIIFWLVLLLAFLGFHAAGYVDPFAILVRGLAQTFYPLFHGLTETFFTWTYTSAPSYVNSVTEPLYAWMKDFLLPAERKYFELVSLSFVVLVLIFLLEMAQKRFFCRNICPLGAMLGMVSRRGLQRVRGGSEQCGQCRICASLCRMGAIDENRRIDMSTCNLCGECAVKCPRQIIGFTYGGVRQGPLPTS